MSVGSGNSGGNQGQQAAVAAESQACKVSEPLCYSESGPVDVNGGASNFPLAKTDDNSNLIVAGNGARKASLDTEYCESSQPSSGPTTQPSESPWTVESGLNIGHVHEHGDIVIIGDANFISGDSAYTGTSNTAPNCLLDPPQGNQNNVDFLREIVDWDVPAVCAERQGGKFLIDVSRSVFDSTVVDFGSITGEVFANGIINGLTDDGSDGALEGRFDILAHGHPYPLTLDDYKSVIVVLPFEEYSCCEMETLLAFVRFGGRLIIAFEAGPAFGPSDSSPIYNDFLGGLPARIVNNLLGGLGSPLTVGTGYVQGYEPSVNGGYLGKATPVNSWLSDLTLCHGVGAPLFTNDAIGQYEVVKYGGPESPPLVVAGRHTLPDSVPEGFCSHTH